MKYKLPLLVGLASLAALVGVQAQTAVTDPVGYITTTIANQVGGLRGETFVGPTLVNKVEFSGAVATASGTTLNFTGTPFAAGQFGGANGPHYLEITNGTTSEGVWSDITATTASSITLLDNLSSFVAAGTTTVKIRKHHTIGSYFGATNTVGLQAGASLAAADQLVILDPSTQLPKIVFYSTDEFAPGWVDSSFNPVSDFVLAPGQGILVKRVGGTSAGTLPFVQTGYVKTGATVLPIEPGENVVSIPNAVGVTLAASGLGSVITQGASLSTADQVVVNTGNNTFDTLFFSTDEFAAGWVDASFNPKGTTLLKEGTAVLIKNTVTPTAFNWTVPGVTISTTP